MKAYKPFKKEAELQVLEENTKLISTLNCVNMIEFIELFHENEEFCMVTEYCPAGNLKTLINTYKLYGKVIREEQVLEWSLQIFNALVHLHKNNIVHGDLNPENIFLNDGRIKVGGVGLAKSYDYFTKTATILTDYAYLSPEVIGPKKLPYTAVSDVWSAGSVIYELISLEKAFKGQGEMEVSKSILNDKIPDVENTLYMGPLLRK